MARAPSPGQSPLAHFCANGLCPGLGGKKALYVLGYVSVSLHRDLFQLVPLLQVNLLWLLPNPLLLFRLRKGSRESLFHLLFAPS